MLGLFCFTNFDVLLTVHLSIILATDQLKVQILVSYQIYYIILYYIILYYIILYYIILYYIILYYIILYYIILRCTVNKTSNYKLRIFTDFIHLRKEFLCMTQVSELGCNFSKSLMSNAHSNCYVHLSI